MDNLAIVIVTIINPIVYIVATAFNALSGSGGVASGNNNKDVERPSLSLLQYLTPLVNIIEIYKDFHYHPTIPYMYSTASYTLWLRHSLPSLGAVA